jgi:hypothetical protein
MGFKIITDKQGTAVEYTDATYTFNPAGFLVVHHPDGRRTTLSAVAWWSIEEEPAGEENPHVW